MAYRFLDALVQMPQLSQWYLLNRDFTRGHRHRPEAQRAGITMEGNLRDSSAKVAGGMRQAAGTAPATGLGWWAYMTFNWSADSLPLFRSVTSS